MIQKPVNAPGDPDLELLHRAIGGDHAAFSELLHRHAATLYRLARARSLTHADAEDVVQEAFIGAFRGMKRFGQRSLVKTWLAQITIRQAMKAWHRQKHDRRTESLDAKAAPELSGDRKPAGQDPIDVVAIIATLTAAHREVLTLKELKGLSSNQIAAILKVPRGTVASRLSRARLELKEKLLRRGWKSAAMKNHLSRNFAGTRHPRKRTND